MLHQISMLKNGFSLITLPKINSNLISIGMLINEIPKKASYMNAKINQLNKNNKDKNEHQKENGVGHFLEHMCFKGTKKYPLNKFINFIDKNNFNINAYTSREHALFTIDCINNEKNLYKSINILKEMILNPLIDKKEIEKEKFNIKAELINFYEKCLAGGELKNLILEFGHRITFGENSFIGRSIIGEFNDIEKMTKEKLVDYHKKYFVPNNMKLIIVGNDPKYNDKIHKYGYNKFKSFMNNYHTENLNRSFKNDNQIVSNFGTEKHFKFDEKILNSTGVGIFFDAPPYTNIKKYFTYFTLEKLLGSYNGIGKGIHLNSNTLSNNNEINITFKECFYLPYKSCGLFGFILTSNSNKNFNRKSMENYLKRIVYNLNEKELKRAKNKIILELLGIDGTNSLLNIMAIQYHYYDKMIKNKYIIDIINRITLDNINKIVKECMDDYKKGKFNYIFIDKAS